MKKLLLVLMVLSFQVQAETFVSLVEKSVIFDQTIFSFPTKNNRIYDIAISDKAKQKKIEDQANAVRPIMHKKVEKLIEDFLTYKRKDGSEIEKSLYKNMSRDSFIDRLLTKRPLMFMTEQDQYVLRNREKGSGGFEDIGTICQKAPLILQDYLSYDEMQIAAFLGVSTPTFFINNGNRYNKALAGKPGTFQEEGIYTGLVGARFERESCKDRPGLMEWQHMIVTPDQNTFILGYGPEIGLKRTMDTVLRREYIEIWSQFYGEKFETFEQVKKDKSGRYIKLDDTMYFDTAIYKKRMQYVIEPFLVDANDRGAKENKKAYCHAVGLGLGVWQKTPIQAKLMLEVYADIVKNTSLPHLADIDFSWFPEQYQTCDGVGDGKILKSGKNNITLHFSKRNPADKLVGKDSDKLLVAMYAWDANAYPGNEYWAGMLTASGDPAAACCSTIPELQNPLINNNVAVKNLFVVG